MKIAFNVSIPGRGSTGMTINLAAEAKNRGIRHFLISFVDLFGTMRAKLVPAAAIEQMSRDGAGFAGFATWLDMTPADPDMLAMPDPDSLIQMPWKPEVGWVAADLWMSGKPVAQAPRWVLKRQIAAAEAQGHQMKTGVEPEFFLISADGTEIADGADRLSKPCYDQSALMRRYDVIAEISDAMEALGWNPYQSDHEDANGQFEMNWHFAPALITADRHAFFKYMVKTIAARHGMRATFMPKPFAELTGSGCHVHVSLWRGEQNLFADPAGELGLSGLAYWFIGGVMAHAHALCALTNPTVNSYKRLNAPTTRSGATWSPNAITRGGNNRTHMVRVPESGRFELRLADGAANPYLLPAAILASGLDGILGHLDPGPCSNMDMYAAGQTLTEARRLPANLLDALRAFSASSVLREALGAEFVDAYVRLKQRDWNSFTQHLTQWELESTLDV
jgi:glutamine synthetase